MRYPLKNIGRSFVPFIVVLVLPGCTSVPPATRTHEYEDEANHTALNVDAIEEPTDALKRFNRQLEEMFPNAPKPDSYVGKAVTMPKLLHAVSPIVPGWASNLRISTTVTCAVFLDDHGRVKMAKVLKTMDARFDDAALQAVKKWVFSAGTLEGKPSPFVIIVPIAFELSGSKSNQRS